MVYTGVAVGKTDGEGTRKGRSRSCTDTLILPYRGSSIQKPDRSLASALFVLHLASLPLSPTTLLTLLVRL